MEQIWYALGCTSPKHELKVRDDARRYGLESFVPLKYEVKTRKGQEQRLLVPAITRFIFVKGTLDEVKDYIANAHFVVFIQRSTFTSHKEYLTVPTKAMENFIAVTEHTERHVTYFRPEEITLREGDKIRVKGGIYDGREGFVMRIKGKRNRHLVVQIPGILIAAVEMSPDMIEMEEGRRKREEVGPLQPKVRCSKSKDIDNDKKLLFDIAHRLLFEFSDKYENENEYYLLRSELQRTQVRLSSFRGYTPATEAELVLPLYLASVVLEADVESVETRLKKAISALKDSSLLKVRCQLYLAILSHDTPLLQQVESKLADLRKSPLSPAQRSLLDEYALCVKK